MWEAYCFILVQLFVCLTSFLLNNLSSLSPTGFKHHRMIALIKQKNRILSSVSSSKVKGCKNGFPLNNLISIYLI